MDTNGPRFAQAPIDAGDSLDGNPVPLERKPWRRSELTVLSVEKTRTKTLPFPDGSTIQHS